MLLLLRIIKGFTFLAFGGGVVISVFYVYLASSTGKPAESFDVFADKDVRRPLVFAHRGGRGLAPENTLTVFQQAVELGVDVLELDIRATRDGELVVIHDKLVDRTTDGTGPVAEKTLREIRRLDAGYRWTADGGRTFPFRGRGIQIPTLREVFDNFPDTLINIEPKHADPAPAKPLCGLIREFGRADRVIVGSFHDRVLEDFRRVCPEVATSASPAEASVFLARYQLGLEDNYTPEMQALQIPPKIGGVEIVTEGYLAAARRSNLQVHVWTVNKTEDMRRLIGIGVDGIMTDYPDRLLDLLDRK